MKVFLSIFTFFWLVGGVTAQQNIAIEQVEAMLVKEEYDEVIAACDTILSTKKSDLDYLRIYQIKADALYYINDIPNSLDNYLKAISSGEEMDNPNLLNLSESYSHAAFCYREMGAFDKAVSLYHQALDLAIQLNDSTEIGNGYSNLGSCYSNVGEFKKGIQYLNKAYMLDLIRKDTSALGFDLREMARLESKMGNHHAAVDHLKESIFFLKRSGGNANSMALRLGNLGTAYVSLLQFDSASSYLMASLKKHETLGDSINMALRWIDLSNLNNKRKNFQSAMEWGVLAKDYYLGLDEGTYGIKANLSLIEAYLGLGTNNSAFQLINQNLNNPLINSLLTERMETYKFQYEVANSQGNNQLAAESLVIYQSLKDSTTDLNNHKALLEIGMKYAVDKAEQQNEILVLENKVARAELSRLQWIIALSIFIIVALIVLGVNMYSRHKLKDKLLMAEIDQLRLQLKGIISGEIGTDILNKDRLNETLEQSLSEREFEILNYALGDQNNSQIAEKVFVSVNTVKFHLKNIYTKLGVNNRKEALQVAIATKNNNF